MTYMGVNSHGPPPNTFSRYLRNKHKTAESIKHCQRQFMILRWNARRLPPTGAIPLPYPLTLLPVGAYLLVIICLEVIMALKPISSSLTVAVSNRSE